MARDEIKRAIFIDYEGSKDKPPTLLGYMVDGAVKAAIVEPCFSDCAGRYRAKHAVAADHGKIVRQLSDLSEKEDRVIISWSEHDYNKMMEVLRADAPAATILRKRFRNAIYSARRWIEIQYPQTSLKRNDLASMMQVTGYCVPEKYGTNLVKDALRLLRKQLTEARKYADLTDAAVKGWRTVAKHNVHDLKGMRQALENLIT